MWTKHRFRRNVHDERLLGVYFTVQNLNFIYGYRCSIFQTFLLRPFNFPFLTLIWILELDSTIFWISKCFRISRLTWQKWLQKIIKWRKTLIWVDGRNPSLLIFYCLVEGQKKNFMCGWAEKNLKNYIYYSENKIATTIKDHAIIVIRLLITVQENNFILYTIEF